MHQQRALRLWRDQTRGTVTITVELPMEEGELVARALDKCIEDEAGNGPEFGDTSYQMQQADALVTLAKRYLGGGTNGRTSSADLYQVMIHVDDRALTAGEGRSDLPVETIRRLSCDGSIVEITDGPDGGPLNVGRKRRTTPPAIKRALWARDGGCAFPGCMHRRFVDAHHARHWSLGGETSLENTMLLCSAHHRLVHEGGYTVRKDEQQRWYFRRPDGRAIPAHGYHPTDMIDDDANPSAEVYAPQQERHEWDGVREARAA